MLSFSRESARKILNGDKTETRRFWEKCRVKVDSLQQAKCEGWYAAPFALLKVVKVWQEALAELDIEAVRREGYEDEMKFLDELVRLNKRKLGRSCTAEMSEGEFAELLAMEPWVVRFELVKRYYEV